jgi:hypothetical protein
MKQNLLSNHRNALGILLIIFLFFVVAFAYFPALLEGKEQVAHDVKTYQGMSKEMADFKKETGEQTLWTNSMFGGMPTYFIGVRFEGNLFEKLNMLVCSIPRPASYLIISFALFFTLLCLLNVNRWIAFGGALLYGLNTFFFVVVQAGHMSKANTLGYLSLVIAGVLLAYNRRQLIGALLAAIGLTLMLAANHPQMTYYGGFMVAIIAITYFIYAIKEKTLAPFFKASALLLLALVLAIGANFGRIYTSMEYSKYSMRGKSDLTPKDDNATSGLDKDYILTYSYDLGEAMTAFIPRFKGGGMSEPLGEKSEVYQLIEKSQGAAQAKKFVQGLPLYWGSQPIANAPFYFGAVLCFLFVLGIFLVKGKERWWILATVFVAFLLSLGKNIPWLAHFMVDYFPGYNKFRDVKNIVVIQNFAMALLGVLALREVYLKNIDKKKFMAALKYSFAITGGLALLFILIPSLAGNFKGNSDAQLVQYGWPEQLINALMADRKMVLRADALRSLIFVSLSVAGLWAYFEGKLKAKFAIIAFVVLVLADMWPVNKKYFNNDHFTTKQKATLAYPKTGADEYILSDKDNFRVLNMSQSVSTFNDASTSYFHKSIGGYHGAKMQRYQEMIEHHIFRDMQMVSTRLRNYNPESGFETIFAGLNALNMLNTKYVIYNNDAAPIPNPVALGNAWMINEVLWVNTPDEEIEAVEKINPSQTAIVDMRYRKLIEGKIYRKDSSGEVKLTSYAPNKLVYQFHASSGQLVVFSEIYYPKGWVATIDGKEEPHFGVNYILRGMMVPEGNHEIVFSFKPKSFEVGNKVSLASSLILLLAVGALVWFELKKNKKPIA